MARVAFYDLNSFGAIPTVSSFGTEAEEGEETVESGFDDAAEAD